MHIKPFGSPLPSCDNSIMHEPENTQTDHVSSVGWGVLGLVLALVLAVGAFLSGVQIGQSDTVAFVRDTNQQTAGFFSFLFPQKQSADGRPDLSEFWRVWDLMEQKFVTASSTSDVSIESRIQGAIEGLVDTYKDPYTVYLPPADAEQFNEDISGNFSGVGMEVGLRNGLVTIIAPLPGTPAERAGLLAGDVIVSIEDTSTEDMRIDEAVRLIRGEKGTSVTLSIFREGRSEFFDVAVTRDTIEIPTVKTERVDDVFIISLYSFNALSEERMQAAMAEYAASGAKKLVLDVRGNPGGFLQSAVTIASYFLPSGKVVVVEESGVGRERTQYRSRNRSQTTQFSPENLVVLVDNGSASASEILAGALKDHGVATIIGTPTFGKGSVQELVDVRNGSSLKVTVARWLTPNGTSISDGGLTPDITIPRTVEDREADRDPQREAALRFMRGEQISRTSFEDRFAGRTE